MSYFLTMVKVTVKFMLATLILGCEKEEYGQPELVVLTRNAPTTLYEGREGRSGPEYDLVRAFAEHNNWTVRFVVKNSIKEVVEGIQKGEGDIAAAGLTRTEQRQKQGILFGPDYFEVQQQVVCRRNSGGIPKTKADLVGKNIQIIASSSYEESLNELKKEFPELQWVSVEDKDTEQLLEAVWLRKIDCTLADSNIVSINRRYFPELVVAFPLSEVQPYAWMLKPGMEGLSVVIEKWLKEAEDSGKIAQIKDRYYGHVELFDYVDMRKFAERVSIRLPKYKALFEVESQKNGFDWKLIAAQAYQESHWNPKAKSPTGVRGLMMLTRTTAKAIGVSNRMDPEQSIRGGVTYLRKVFDQLPDEVQGEDRIWFALAAYNIGLGHLRDAQQLALRESRNPNRWVDIQAVLPLLSQKAYYKTLKYGYARGREPIRYVQRIRSYREVLTRLIDMQNVSSRG